MHTVILEGHDLDYFADIVARGTNGHYGVPTVVQVYVQDDGQLVLGMNGMTSRAFGRPNSALVQDTPTPEQAVVQEAEEVAALANTAPSDEGDTRNFPPEGSGNPYANVPQEDSFNPAHMTLEQRVARLEGLQHTSTLVYEGLTRITERLTNFAENASQQYDIHLDPIPR